MSQRDKLLEKIRNHPKSVSFDDLDSLLRMYGYELKRTNGSHHIYACQGRPPINVTRHGAQVHSAAVKEVLQMVEELSDNN
jgi:predicted RNA binding protein YcfA (HicA-like mRNA interferase family)